MSPESFVIEVVRETIDRAALSYRDLYENPRAAAEEITFFEDLSPEKRETFFKIIRQVQIDTIANLFALLDGSYWLKGQASDLNLSFVDKPGSKLNGELADLFLNSVNKSP